VKIVPANQTLILAGEPGGPGRAANSLLRSASGLVAGGPDLQRLTVTVQADYYLPGRSAVPRAPRLERNSQQGVPLRSATISSYLSPIELYSRTQRGLDEEPRVALLDVRA
jgi:hypothetical protein